MNELNQNIDKIAINKYIEKNRIDLNGNSTNFNLSHSIKIFKHKSNCILFKSRLHSCNSEKNILKKKINLFPGKDIQLKKNVPRKKNLILNSPRNIVYETKKIFISNFNIKDNSSILHNLRKNNSCSDFCLNNNSLSLNTKDNSMNNIMITDKNKIKNEIEKANFKISLLYSELYNINKKLTKSRNEVNLMYLKFKLKLEKIKYKKMIYYYKLKLFKTKENFININKLKDNIEKEELFFKTQKLYLIEKILELNTLIDNIKENNLDNRNENSFSDSENDIYDMSTDEMLITKNNNICKINQFSPNLYK